MNIKKEEIDLESLYDDFQYTNRLLSDIIDKVVDVGDLETMLEIEHILNEKGEYARQRAITEEINEIIRQSDGINIEQMVVKEDE